MKIFQSIKKYLATLGIRPPQSDRETNPLNSKHLMPLIVFGVVSYYGHEYLFVVANTFEEYTDGLYQCATSTVNAFDYVVHISITYKLYKFIEDFETFIGTSESESENRTRTICHNNAIML